jgi:transcriptional regulator with XRE-family HTH domain
LKNIGPPSVPKSAFTNRYRNFRLKLVEYRKRADVTQIDLAARLKRTQSFVSKFERGERRLDVIEFFDLARAIGFDPVEFFQEIGEIRPPRKGSRRL